MKGQGKSNPTWEQDGGVRSVFTPVYKRCAKKDCGKGYKVMPYKTGIDLLLCPKHREEEREREAEEILSKRLDESIDRELQIA